MTGCRKRVHRSLKFVSFPNSPLKTVTIKTCDKWKSKKHRERERENERSNKSLEIYSFGLNIVRKMADLAKFTVVNIMHFIQ